MTALKLSLDEFDEVDYDLIAIHSSLEDYRLSYLLNQKLSINLSKNSEEIGVTVKEGEALFPKFVFDDQANDILWSLVCNKNEVVVRKTSTGQNLFLNTKVEIATIVYLLPELKKVDYFLKIENNIDTVNIDSVIAEIKTINGISTVYTIIPEKIRSKNNLIF